VGVVEVLLEVLKMEEWTWGVMRLDDKGGIEMERGATFPSFFMVFIISFMDNDWRLNVRAWTMMIGSSTRWRWRDERQTRTLGREFMRSETSAGG
jgi:hypothetical protein